MTVATAALALLLHVGQLAARRHFAIAADDATAAESGEAEKPNETHDALHHAAEQFACRRFPSAPAIRSPYISAAREAERMAARELF